MKRIANIIVMAALALLLAMALHLGLQGKGIIETKANDFNQIIKELD